ncbi:MAG: Hypothetical protein BHV28_15540 [Candidatus Tokpelaia hoelldobleri]|uniref:DUF3100 domain-containing protein n=1 Tax=Candidatus Tokpelaia hoelldobleri TaxID=1902579 RepID=A0A1U9JWI6_9HYPH|nr:MAG: Hypothetical protein BHV28_15540 [Candidatus Tokpelaia hoelldoblerii]
MHEATESVTVLDTGLEKTVSETHPQKPQQKKLLSVSAVVFVYGMMIVCVGLAEAIGNVEFFFGKTRIVLFPIIWALLVGVIISFAHRSMRGQAENSLRLQRIASLFIQSGIYFFVIKISFNIGKDLPVLYRAGWALAFQEVGHFVGPLVALPLALVLGIKREAVGATFSIGREVSIAIVSERYGMNSPEGRGVMAEYIIGTIFGAVFIATLAGFISGLDWFKPTSLAMGAGVGSGSMMAAAMAAIAAHHPEAEAQIVSFAGAANILTTAVGTYFIMFLALPMTNWLYNRLEPVLGRRKADDGWAETAEETKPSAAGEKPDSPPVWEMFATMTVCGVTLLFSNWIATGFSPAETIAVFAIMAALILVGYVLQRLLSFLHIPLLIWMTTAAVLAASPISPVAGYILKTSASVGVMPLATPVLAFAGLSLVKDLPVLKNLGWRIVAVSLAANAGTFIFGTILAEIFH